eukprot:gene2376-3127_t
MPVGYKSARKEILHALRNGNYQHESRGDIDVKNLLAMGKISATEVAVLIASSDGSMHTESPHHVVKEITVHRAQINSGTLMKLFIDGDQGRAICDHCKKMVSLTFKRRDVPFSDKKGFAHDIL